MRFCHLAMSMSQTIVRFWQFVELVEIPEGTIFVAGVEGVVSVGGDSTGLW